MKTAATLFALSINQVKGLNVEEQSTLTSNQLQTTSPKLVQDYLPNLNDGIYKGSQWRNAPKANDQSFKDIGEESQDYYSKPVGLRSESTGRVLNKVISEIYRKIAQQRNLNASSYNEPVQIRILPVITDIQVVSDDQKKSNVSNNDTKSTKLEKKTKKLYSTAQKQVTDQINDDYLSKDEDDCSDCDVDKDDDDCYDCDDEKNDDCYDCDDNDSYDYNTDKINDKQQDNDAGKDDDCYGCDTEKQQRLSSYLKRYLDSVKLKSNNVAKDQKSTNITPKWTTTPPFSGQSTAGYSHKSIFDRFPDFDDKLTLRQKQEPKTIFKTTPTFLGSNSFLRSQDYELPKTYSNSYKKQDSSIPFIHLKQRQLSSDKSIFDYFSNKNKYYDKTSYQTQGDSYYPSIKASNYESFYPNYKYYTIKPISVDNTTLNVKKNATKWDFLKKASVTNAIPAPDLLYSDMVLERINGESYVKSSLLTAKKGLLDGKVRLQRLQMKLPKKPVH